MRFEQRDEAGESCRRCAPNDAALSISLCGTKLAVAQKYHSTCTVARFEQVIVCVTELVIESSQLKAQDARLLQQLKSTLTLE